MSYSSYSDHYRDQEEFEKRKKRAAEIEAHTKAISEQIDAKIIEKKLETEQKIVTDQKTTGST